mmetsp:Transcript_24039/g.65025  ORF Transcript_24039/g.65025 Transcript_24039/m.65025 type:complete len:282 (+) Transcript_24039:45-890(+)
MTLPHRFSSRGAGLVQAGYVLLSVFMLVWLVGMPFFAAIGEDKMRAAEAAIRASNRRTKVAEKAVMAMRADKVFVPFTIVTKHFKHFSVRATHHLGAGIWTLCGLAQFGLPRETQAARTRHRVVGWLYMLSVVLLTVGFVLILAKDLHADNDFRAAFPEVAPRTFVTHGGTLVALCALQAWFIYTAVSAWTAARGKHFSEHRAWMARHAASGLWVSGMRFLGPPSQLIVNAVLARPIHGDVKLATFGADACISIALCILGAEVYLRTPRLTATLVSSKQQD